MKPVLQALILADRVYEDKATGKKIIAGTFNQLIFQKQAVREVTDDEGSSSRVIALDRRGMQAGSPFAYISLTDVHEEAPFVLRYVDLADNKVLLQTTFKVVCPDPLQTVEVVLPLPNLPAEKAGVHALELLWNDELMGSFRITIKEVPVDPT